MAGEGVRSLASASDWVRGDLSEVSEDLDVGEGEGDPEDSPGIGMRKLKATDGRASSRDGSEMHSVGGDSAAARAAARISGVS